MASPGIPVMEHPNLSITQRNQQMSPFLRLPAEVRLIIYDYTYIGSTVHIGSPRYWLHPALEYLTRLSHATALLQTCKQIRHEALPAFYKYCTFDFTSFESWPTNCTTIEADVAKDIQLIAISSRAALLLEGRENWCPQGLVHQAEKKWIRTLVSLRRVTLSRTRIFHFVAEIPEATVEGVRCVFEDPNLEVDL